MNAVAPLRSKTVAFCGDSIDTCVGREGRNNPQPCAPEIRSYGLYAESERAARGAAQDLSPGGQEQARSLRDARGQGAEGAGRLALGDGTRRLLLESENRGNTVVTVQRHRQRQRAATRRAWPCVAWGVSFFAPLPLIFGSNLQPFAAFMQQSDSSARQLDDTPWPVRAVPGP